MRFLVVTLFVITCALASPSRAQFRNDGVYLPSVGWLALNTWDVARGAQGDAAHSWNTWDQPQLGLGAFHAVGYNLWIDGSAALGASSIVLDDNASTAGGGGTPVMSLTVSAGARYTFDLGDERLRPFAAIHVDYLQLFEFSDASQATDAAKSQLPDGLVAGAHIYVGARPALGVEYVFTDDMGVLVEAGPDLFVAPGGIAGWIFPASQVRAAFCVYF